MTTICMTQPGPDLRKKLFKICSDSGFECHEKLRRSTDILLYDDKDWQTEKIKNAKKWKIKMVRYSDFFVDADEKSSWFEKAKLFLNKKR